MPRGNRLETLERQLLRYLERPRRSAGAPRVVRRAQTLRQRVVRERVRRCLALQRLGHEAAWPDVRLTATEADACAWLAAADQAAVRKALLRALLAGSIPPEPMP